MKQKKMIFKNWNRIHNLVFFSFLQTINDRHLLLTSKNTNGDNNVKGW